MMGYVHESAKYTLSDIYFSTFQAPLIFQLRVLSEVTSTTQRKGKKWQKIQNPTGI